MRLFVYIENEAGVDIHDHVTVTRFPLIYYALSFIFKGKEN